MSTRIWLPQLLLGGLMLLALNKGNPYGFYVFLRLAATVGFLYLTLKAIERKKPVWVYAFLGFLILYNPIFKVSFPRETWGLINVATAIALVASIFTMDSVVKKNPH